MSLEAVQTIIRNEDAYAYVLNNEDPTLDDYKEILKENNVTGGTFSRKVDFFKDDPPGLSVVDGHISVDPDAFSDAVMSFAKFLKVDEVFTHAIEAAEELEGKRQDLAAAEARISEMQQDYKASLAEKDNEIKTLRTENASLQEDSSLKNELDRKILVSSSIEIGPVEKPIDDLFLVDPDLLLDVDKCVAIYGGGLDSFYTEILDDKEPDMATMEPGHELTQQNHTRLMGKHLFTERFFKKRVEDNAVVHQYEEEYGPVTPKNHAPKTKRELMRRQILHNRFVSINKIIENRHLSNQEKLAMYAMNTEIHNSNIEKILKYCGANCLNANWMIYFLEDPDTATTYENTIAFLEQFVEPSEYRMKLDLARQLIEGKWYIKAKYNGKDTKFQLVPVEEFNELRKKAGLPPTKFRYVGPEGNPEVIERMKGEVKEPAFVQHAPHEATGDIPYFDDGFEPASDDSEEE